MNDSKMKLNRKERFEDPFYPDDYIDLASNTEEVMIYVKGVCILLPCEVALKFGNRIVEMCNSREVKKGTPCDKSHLTTIKE